MSTKEESLSKPRDWAENSYFGLKQQTTRFDDILTRTLPRTPDTFIEITK